MVSVISLPWANISQVCFGKLLYYYDFKRQQLHVPWSICVCPFLFNISTWEDIKKAIHWLLKGLDKNTYFSFSSDERSLTVQLDRTTNKQVLICSLNTFSDITSLKQRDTTYDPQELKRPLESRKTHLESSLHFFWFS